MFLNINCRIVWENWKDSVGDSVFNAFVNRYDIEMIAPWHSGFPKKFRYQAQSQPFFGSLFIATALLLEHIR